MQSKHFLRDQVFNALKDYFAQLGESSASNLYHLVLSEVEAPLLQFVMQHTEGNQSLAARMLGLNRGTLRKLLAKYNLA